MKKVLSSIHLPFFIFGSIAILIVGVIALFVVLNPVQAQVFVDLIKKPFNAVDLVTANKVEIYRDQNTLRMKFQIEEKDKQSFIMLSEKLGVTTKWQEGISFNLDEESMNQIEPYLPLTTDVSIEGNIVTLTGNAFNFMPSGGVGDEVYFATEGATLKFARGTTQADLYLTQPEHLISYATASGKVNLSRKIESELFSLASKVDTIDIEIKGKSVEGKIVLK